MLDIENSLMVSKGQSKGLHAWSWGGVRVFVIEKELRSERKRTTPIAVPSLLEQTEKQIPPLRCRLSTATPVGMTISSMIFDERERGESKTKTG
jgi:hypothetical protein